MGLVCRKVGPKVDHYELVRKVCCRILFGFKRFSGVVKSLYFRQEQCGLVFEGVHVDYPLRTLRPKP